MKLNMNTNVRRMGGLFAIMFAIAMILSATAPVLGQGANAPTLNVGDSAYFGGIKDIGEEYQNEIEDSLQDFEDMGFDVNVDVNGGAGAYFGWEVVSNSADIGGNTCYDIALMGAVGIDLGIDASVKGSMSEYGTTISADGKGNAVVKGEAVLDGHLYLTVDELAVAKIQLKLTADAEAKVFADVTASYAGDAMKIKADATGSIDGVEFNLVLTFDPPIDLYDFPINQGDTWYVPAEDTLMTGTASAKGTVSYDVEATITDEEPIDESETLNLATEIGTQTISETIPGGQPVYEWGYPMGGGTMFSCTSLVGTTAVIEMDMFGMLEGEEEVWDDFGTRQFDSLLDPTSMMPEMGLQIDTTKGMMTGVVMGGEVMTTPATEAEVEDFVENPQGTVTSETGGAGSALGGLLVILVVVIVLVVVVVVVLMVVMKKKKTPPAQQYPQQQPMYGPQPGYEQPPPQYPQPDQYGNYPPPPPPPPGQ
ncbi:MAG: hypothetical protein R6W91_02800 [Thermoplasmata archaeon]